MKKLISSFLAISSIAVILFSASGCDNDSSSGSEENTTAAAATVEATTAATEENVLESLHSYKENADDFAGAWKISEGSGSQFESFVYLFDGNGKANLVMGTTGYISTYSASKTDKQLTCQLMYGINGIYDYEKENDDTIVLTNTSSEETTTLTKIDNFSVLPTAQENPIIDDKLVGAWKSDNGEYFYFDKNGIMYQNQFSMAYTYYTYSAADGKINAVSDMGSGEQNTEYEYTVDGDTLTLNGDAYTKIELSELE